MNSILRLLLSLSVSGSIFILLMFLVKPMIKDRLSKRVQYLLWIIIIARLISPFSLNIEGPLDSIIDTQNVSESTLSYSTDNNNTSANTTIDSNDDNIIVDRPIVLADKKPVVSPYTYVMYIWLIGVVAYMLFTLFSYFRYTRLLKDKYTRDIELEDEYLSRARYKYISIYKSDLISSPMLIGIFKPKIIISTKDYTRAEIKNIILHELTHVRHLDIPIKWLSVIAQAIHWFNPFVFMMRRELNLACELACDESVIKDFSSKEKQCYGDTLISVASNNHNFRSALQATMSEEKRGLKNRLISIMKNGKKSKLIWIISAATVVLIVAGALYLGPGINEKHLKAPILYIAPEFSDAKVAKLGAYEWKIKGTTTVADSIDPADFQYDDTNTIYVSGGESINISNQKIKIDKKHNFSVSELKIYDINKNLIKIIKDISSDSSYANIQAPIYTGEFIYVLKLDYSDNGYGYYGFKLVTNILNYNLDALMEYKTPYVGNASKVSALASSVPVPNESFIQRFISLITDSKPYGMTVYYETQRDMRSIKDRPDFRVDSDIHKISKANAIILFSMIDNVDEIEFAFRLNKTEDELDDSKYLDRIVFDREDLEKQYGRLKVGEDTTNLKKTIEEYWSDLNKVSDTSIYYTNLEFGFRFKLPKSWLGYKAYIDKWHDENSNESGMISIIRNPKWTNEVKYQDIPIMIFTHNQWDRVKSGDIIVSAAPTSPIEIGRNEEYVFAIPARYNFAYLKGYEEVEEILGDNPLEGM